MFLEGFTKGFDYVLEIKVGRVSNIFEIFNIIKKTNSELTITPLGKEKKKRLVYSRIK